MSWDNSNNVNQTLDKMDQTGSVEKQAITDYCKITDATTNPASDVSELPGGLSSTREVQLRPKPYGSPPCSFFAVLEKPRIHPGIQEGNSNPESWCNKYPGNVSGPTIGDLPNCADDNAPGGLADPTETIKIKGDDFMRYGFILGNDTPDHWHPNYSVDNSGDSGLYISPTINTITGDALAPFTKTTTTPYSGCECGIPPSIDDGQKNELSETLRQRAANYYSPTGKLLTDPAWTNSTAVSVITNNKETPYSEIAQADPSDKVDTTTAEAVHKCPASDLVNMDSLSDKNDNACGQYIKKWAETCKWCKDQTTINPGDEGFGCAVNGDCRSGVCEYNSSALSKCTYVKEKNLREQGNGRHFNVTAGSGNTNCNAGNTTGIDCHQSMADTMDGCVTNGGCPGGVGGDGWKCVNSRCEQLPFKDDSLNPTYKAENCDPSGSVGHECIFGSVCTPSLEKFKETFPERTKGTGPLQYYEGNIDGLENLVYGTCKGIKPDCSICDSDFWKWIPGGWEAVVDENHPLHNAAVLAYVPKTQFTDPGVTENFSSCTQPDGRPIACSGGLSNKCVDSQGTLNNRSDCDVVEARKQGLIKEGLGELAGNNCVSDKAQFCSRNPIVGFGGATVDGRIRIQFPSNNCDTLCNEGSPCSRVAWEGEDITQVLANPGTKPSTSIPGIFTLPVSDTAWKDLPGNTEGRDLITSCPGAWLRTNQDSNNSGTNDESTELDGSQKTVSFRLMCERNPALSLFGTSNQENSDLTNSWMNGKINLTKYGKGIITDPNVDEAEKKDRETKALRCCTGLSPYYESTDPTTNQNILGQTITDLTEGRKDCPPASVCPSSNFCQDLYKKAINNELNVTFDLNDFGMASYPTNYKLEGNPSLTRETMENPAYYTKAYCQMMSGGSFPSGRNPIDGSLPGETIQVGFDDDINTMCRKTMYNYLISPQEVETTTYGTKMLPTNIFSDSAVRWCKVDELKSSMPNQYGVCDMAIGSSCQRLEADGWINPNDFNSSKIISEAGSTISGLNGDRIRDVCGCFMMGATCKSGNCSYNYCGAGTKGERGPGTVSLDKWSGANSNLTNALSGEEDLTVYNKDGWSTMKDSTAPEWTSDIDQNFTCVGSDGTSTCYKNCNYVNYNDTCWNASPNERKIGVQNWKCDFDDGDGNDCSPFSGEGNYGCFGECPS